MKPVLKTQKLLLPQVQRYLSWAKRSLFILGFSLITLGVNELSVLAQTRQPTNAELKKLRQELQQFIRSVKNNRTGVGYLQVQDRLTQVEKKTRESFVRAWSKTEPGLAPFMGIWSGYEHSEHIYPSNTKGKVCIVSTGEGSGSLTTGILSNGLIKINGRKIMLFKEGNFLGYALLKNDRFVSDNGEIPLNNPTPIEPLNRLLLEYISEASEKSKIEKQFKAAGCTSSLPNSSANKYTTPKQKRF